MTRSNPGLTTSPRIRAAAHLLLSAILTGAAAAQTTAQTTAPTSPPDELKITTTLVQVPTLVQTAPHDLVYSLSARDFRLTDNGIPQRVTLDPDTAEPLSIVLLVQTGASAPRLFNAYSHLTAALDPLLRAPGTQVAVVTFDSHPEAALAFTDDLTPWADAINHPDPGDSGAAIFDALDFSLDLLAHQPRRARRVILLLSQPHDLGSKITLGQIVRRVGETDTAVYSLTFSAAKANLKGAFTDPSHGNPPWTVGNRSYVQYFDLMAPLNLALTAMEKNSAAELANLSGGEAVQFSSRVEIEAALGTLANHLPNRYLLTFQPTSAQPGLHALEVRLPDHPGFRISARANYWADPIAAPMHGPSDTQGPTSDRPNP